MPKVKKAIYGEIDDINKKYLRCNKLFYVETYLSKCPGLYLQWSQSQIIWQLDVIKNKNKKLD